MRADEFDAAVRDHGGYEDAEQARRTTLVVLELLGERLVGGEADDLAAQLPAELQEPLRRAAGSAGRTGVDEFLAHAAERLGTTPQTAKNDVSAVLATVAQQVTGGELDDLLEQLPEGFAELFGRADLG